MSLEGKVSESLEFIRNSLENYERVAVLSSWGKDSIVVLDLLRRMDIDLPVIWIDIPFLPDETAEMKEKLEDLWNLNVKAYKSSVASDPERFEKLILNPNLPETNPEACCQILKVEPAMEAVKDLDLNAWISGLRGTESESRSHFSKEFEQGEFTKLHPILNWSEEDVWDFIKKNDLPYHPWYDEGMRSIGCKPCTVPSNPDQSERQGRWPQRPSMCDCGIHETSMR